MTQLSEHFTLAELVHSDTANAHGIDNSPTEAHIENLKRVVKVLENIRTILGVPLNVTSGYRSPALNKVVGGVDASAHSQGLAADFVAPPYTPMQIVDKLMPYRDQSVVDQLLVEDLGGATWIHVGLSAGDPRRQVAKIDSGGFHLLA